MSKYKLVSYLFILLGVLVIIGSAYVIISYASDIINAIVNFVTTNDYSKLQQCGVTPPSQFNKLKNEFATVILPVLYIGLPAILIVISALMFLAGFYYYRGRLEDESRKQEELEREMVHKIVKKMETERAGAPQRAVPPPAKRPEAEDETPEEAKGLAPEEPEEEAAVEKEPEELPKPKIVTKKKK
jgi:hypothetical protein